MSMLTAEGELIMFVRVDVLGGRETVSAAYDRRYRVQRRPSDFVGVE
jgi:hypothetical protein